MSKPVSFIKISKDLVKDSQYKVVNFKDVLEFEIKNYLPAIDKLTLIQVTLDSAFQINDEAGMKFFNEKMKNIIFQMMLVKYYTNLKIDDDLMENYDILSECGLLDFIIENINEKEKKKLETALESRINEEYDIIVRGQQFGNVLKSLVDKLNSNLPEVVESLKNFDPQKLEFLNQMNKTLNNKDNLQ